MGKPVEVWAEADAYEPYVGRWSRLVARELLGWLGMGRGARWLDLGCGTGALSGTILDLARPAALLGVDRSEGYVRHARAALAGGPAAFVVADGRRLPVADGGFDAAASGLVLNFVPEPGLAVREMARVTRPGGRIAAYLWDYADGMQLIRRFWDAATALDPAAAELDEGQRFGLCRPGPLAALFEDAGIERVEVRALEVPTTFRDFDDYWSPFLGGQGPAPGYAVGLPDARLAALREELRSRLPVAADGSIPLTARAWAAAGSRPG
jgi:SAM-dependent methyltransferase